MKRIAAIHDISGVGKCSLTAVIPIVSAFGIECNPVPTALLSTHTGDISGYTFKDLSSEMLPICRHWKSLGIYPDAVFSGYLGSRSQVEAVKEIIDGFTREGKRPFVAVDPAMADSGALYKGFEDDFPALMGSLCRCADLIIPNITEACLLTGMPYSRECGRDFTESLVVKLGEFTRKYVVLTGVSFDKDSMGCCVYDGSEIRYTFGERYPGTYYGTGDIFASVLVSSMMIGMSCFDGAEAAVRFTSSAIKETYELGIDPRFGVTFENHLPMINEFKGDVR